jgi:hypothetical protein
MLSMTITAFAAPMTDIENHWAKEQINAWVAKDLIKGYEDETFRPDNISRAEFMALINRAWKEPRSIIRMWQLTPGMRMW